MSSAASQPVSASIVEGQTVKFIPREANSEARVVPYYDFYNNLTGTIAKVYPDGTAAVIIDRSSLPVEARERHEKSERDMRDKWMKSLSEDDRNKLTDIQKQFNLRYTLLISASDLIDIDAAQPAIPEKASKKLTDKEPARPTEDVLSAAEEAHLIALKNSSPVE